MSETGDGPVLASDLRDLSERAAEMVSAHGASFAAAYARALLRAVGNVAPAPTDTIVQSALPSSVKPGDAELVNDLRNKIAKAMNIVHALNQPRGSDGARSWSMSIPARPDYDPDIIICDALIAAERLAAARLSVREGEWLPIETAPKDGTLLVLLVEYDANDEGGNPLEDSAEPTRTIGFNNFDHDSEDKWLMAGWCWSHDHFTSGSGKVVAYQPLPKAPA